MIERSIMPGLTLPASQRSIMVLLVDDQVMVAEAMRRALIGEADIEFHYCPDCPNALEVAKRVNPTVILQDLVMPGIHGLDLVRAYRTNRQTATIPIIVLSTKEEAAIKSEAFSVGANDYLVKLPEPVELIARIRYHSNAYLAQLQRDDAYRALRRSQQELTETNLELQRLTQIDGLTGLNNRRYLDNGLLSEWKHAARTRSPLSAMMIDIDHFKLYNDSYGHLAGDEVLKMVAAAIKSVCRRSGDITARFGGEEFIAVLPGAREKEMQAIADELVARVGALAIPHASSPTSDHLTISVGVATLVPDKADQPTRLIKAADEALYRANVRRNRALS